MGSNNNSMFDRITSLTDQELINMLEIDFNDYTEEAINMAKEEISKRGGLDIIKNQLSPSEKKELKEKESEKNKEKWYEIKEKTEEQKNDNITNTESDELKKPDESDNKKQREIKLNSKGYPFYIWITFPISIIFYYGIFILFGFGLITIIKQDADIFRIIAITFLDLSLFIIVLVFSKTIWKFIFSKDHEEKYKNLETIHLFGIFASGFIVVVFTLTAIFIGLIEPIIKSMEIDVVKIAWTLGAIAGIYTVIKGFIK